MSTLGDRVDAAIRASGKSGDEIAQALGLSPETIRRIRKGREDNPKVQVLLGIAEQTGTTAAALLANPLAIAPDDEQELLHLRAWIDRKLAMIDALAQPNAEIVHMPAAAKQVADRPYQRPEYPFGADAAVVLRALGESMTGAGILPDDQLYAIAFESTETPPIDRIVACRIGGAVFVKRLAAEKGRLLLVSANPRYRPIVLDGSYEIFAIVIGRVGSVA